MPQRVGCCNQCSCPWAEASLEALAVSGRSPIVYGLSTWVEVQVTQLRCKCDAVRVYDGGSDGILNLDNLDLFTHELLSW